MEVQQKTCALTQFGSYVQVKKFPSVLVATARPSVICPHSVHNALHSAANICRLLAMKHSQTTSRRRSSVAISAISSNGKRKRNVKEAFHDEMANRYGDVIRIKSQCCQFLFLCKKKTMHKDLRDVVCVQWQSTVPRFISVHPWMFSSRPLKFKFVDANVKSAEPAPATCALCCPAKNEHSEP